MFFAQKVKTGDLYFVEDLLPGNEADSLPAQVGGNWVKCNGRHVMQHESTNWHEAEIMDEPSRRGFRQDSRRLVRGAWVAVVG